MARLRLLLLEDSADDADLLAIELARAHDAALPFVVLSGFVAEDRPADDRAGDADAWVCKDRMHEITPVLRRLLSR